jgi:hypothetical protein
MLSFKQKKNIYKPKQTKTNQKKMEMAMLSVLDEIATQYNLEYMDLVQRYSAKLKSISEQYEDLDIDSRCRGRNKNNKRCSKPKKDNSEYCAIHYTQHLDEERHSEYINTLDLILATNGAGAGAAAAAPTTTTTTTTTTMMTKSSFRLLETSSSKKKGVYPEQIKKIILGDTKYYMNKNYWVYEMDQGTEMILSDLPIGKLFNDKLIRISMDIDLPASALDVDLPTLALAAAPAAATAAPMAQGVDTPMAQGED